MQRIIRCSRGGLAGAYHYVNSRRRIDAPGGGAEAALHFVAHDGPTHCLAGDEAEACDLAVMWNYAKDKQLVSVDTTSAVRGGKVLAPA